MCNTTPNNWRSEKLCLSARINRRFAHRNGWSSVLVHLGINPHDLLPPVTPIHQYLYIYENSKLAQSIVFYTIHCLKTAVLRSRWKRVNDIIASRDMSNFYLDIIILMKLEVCKTRRLQMRKRLPKGNLYKENTEACLRYAMFILIYSFKCSKRKRIERNCCTPFLRAFSILVCGWSTTRLPRPKMFFIKENGF